MTDEGNAWQFNDKMRNHFRRHPSTENFEVVFRTEERDYRLVDVESDPDTEQTVILLQEYGE